MTNQYLVPVVTIHLDCERHLKYDFGALLRLQKQTGRSALNAEIWNDLGLENISALLWAGLLHETPEITVEQAAALIYPGNMKAILDAITLAWSGSMPESKETAEDSATDPLAVDVPTVM